jgi:hypothetical protein
MKTRATSRLFLCASFLGIVGLAVLPVAGADKVCEDKCQADWPRAIVHSVPRNACLAKCWAVDKARAAVRVAGQAVDKVKEVGGRAVDKVKEVGGRAVDKVKEVGGRVVDKVKEVGGQVVAGVKKIAHGLWDKAQKCFADGVGGCLKRVLVSALTSACKGVGLVWDEASQCCARKGVVECLKEAGKKLVKKGAAWLCKQAMPAVAPKLYQAGAWLLEKAGAALKNYQLSLKGSEIGALACAFKAAAGHTITDVSRKFGDPTLTLHGIQLHGERAGDKLHATFAATATLAPPPGQSGSLALTAGGSVDIHLDTSCNFEGPLATITARVDRVSVSKIPQWFTTSATQGFVNPSLGCFTFCPPVLKPAGMDLQLNYCKVIDACLKSPCTKPVLNAVLSQIFPVSLPVERFLPGKKKDGSDPLARVRQETKNWAISIGGVKVHPNLQHPYRPSVTASVAIGPPGKEKFVVQATGSLAINTYCQESGESMIKVTPSLSLKLGEVPEWMQSTALPNIANNYLQEFVNRKGGKDGSFVIPYPAFLSGKTQASNEPSTQDVSRGLLDKIKASWQGLETAVRTVLAGRFRGNPVACDAVPRPESRGGSRSCIPCLKLQPREVATEAAAPSTTETTLGHITGRTVNFRSGPSTSHPVLSVLRQCTEVQIVGTPVAGQGGSYWTPVQVGQKRGYVSTRYLGAGGTKECRR